MLLRELFESPNFGYKSFVNRDADIAKLLWNVEFEKGTNGKIEAITVKVRDKDSKSGTSEGLILGRRNIFYNELTLQIAVSKIYPNRGWESTGLGQMLYDKIIAEAKKAGFRYVISDYILSGPAKKAWAKLPNRYPVTREDVIEEDDKFKCYMIDLNKVVLKESPDFSYTKYRNRERDFKNMEFRIIPSKYGYNIHALFNKKLVGFIDVLAHNIARVSFSKIDSGWKGTGLGQLLYDKAIEEAKKRGLKKFQSDTQLSGDARSAWAKLSTRHYVDHIDDGATDYFSVDLRK